ncbi:MAG: hypothetical protein EZS28_053099, partial [Streblomastix strix]
RLHVQQFQTNMQRELREQRRLLFIQGSQREFILRVDRSRLFASSYDALKDVDASLWALPLRVIFQGELGIDAGGLTREWLTNLISSALNVPSPSASTGRLQRLFSSSPDTGYRYSIVPSSSRELIERLPLYRFIGMVLGKAVLEQVPVPARFDRVVFKTLLGTTLDLTDIEGVDRELYEQLRHMEEDDSVNDWGLTFSLEEEEEQMVVDTPQVSVVNVENNNINNNNSTNANSLDLSTRRINSRQLPWMKSNLRCSRSSLCMFVWNC